MIYFAQEEKTHLIKIGFSRDPLERMAHFTGKFPIQLRPLMSLLIAIRGEPVDEKKMHAKFEEYRVPKTVEWFYPRDHIFNYIRFLKQTRKIIIKGPRAKIEADMLIKRERILFQEELLSGPEVEFFDLAAYLNLDIIKMIELRAKKMFPPSLRLITLSNCGKFEVWDSKVIGEWLKNHDKYPFTTA